MAYTLYIANKRYSSWSMRPWVLLKAYNIPFTEKLVFFQSDVPVQREYLKFSPTGLVPCLHDADGDHYIWESLALCEYIAEKHPEVWPADRIARAFARSAAAEMHAGFHAIRSECGMNVGVRVAVPVKSARLEKDLNRLTQLFNEGQAKFGGPWIAGKEYSVADAFFVPIASRLKTYTLSLDGEAGKYIERLWEHPATQTWVKQGIAETEREPGHEVEMLQGGRKLIAELKPE